jgi:regulator of sigma E protease
VILTLVGIVAAVLGVSVLIVIHEAGHFLVARGLGMKVERFSVGFGPVLFSTRRAGTEFAVSALPLGGYVKITGMAPGEDVDPSDPSLYSNQAAWRRFLAILAGPAMNYVSAVLIGVVLLLGPGLRTPDQAAAVGRVLEGSAAAQAGLQLGDRVLAIAGRPVSSWDDLVREIQSHPGQPVDVAVERGQGAAAQRLAVRLTPRDEGGTGRAGFEQHAVPLRSDGPGPALAAAFHRTNAIAWSQVTVFGKRGTKLMGPLGLGNLLVNAWRDGGGAFVNLLWVLSVVLAVLNLFPLPALDGGRLVFLAYEVVTRRRVDARVEGVVHMVGFVALILLLVGVTVFGDLGLGSKLSHLGGR